MPLDFPASPTNGQVYGSYVYNSTVGAWQAREDSATVATISTVFPTNANPGDIWYDSDDGTSYIYYDDGTSAQWVELLSSGLPLLDTKADIAGDTFTGNVTAPRFISNVANGTSPLLVTSTTVNTNLNADLLDGNHATDFALLSGASFTGNLIVSSSGTLINGTNGSSTIATSDAGKTPLTVRGTTSQTADLQQWHNSSGTVLSYMDNTGKLFAQDLSLIKNTAHIELGGVSGTANTPYIDFHSSAAFSDYNARIIADGGTASQASGNLTIQAAQLNLPTKTYMPGAVVQVQEYRTVAGDKTASSGAYVSIASISFTTKLAGSKLLIIYYSGQMNPGSAQSNPMFEFQIDGTAISDFSTNHIFYSDAGTFTTRPNATIPIMTGVLTQGAHTILIRGGAYNSSYTFDFQTTGSPERRGRIIVMEVAQ